MKNALSALAVSLFLISCGPNEPDRDDSLAPSVSAATSTDTTAAVPGTTPTVPLGQAQPTMVGPNGVQVVAPNTTTRTVVPATSGNTQTSNAGMNPAHGQPGHRCDIAVGAPLNSAPTASPVQPSATMKTTTTPSNIVAQPQANPAPAQPVAAGMNPAHGQPGHRCDISVGAPLNSKPNATAAPAVSPGALNQVGTTQQGSALIAPVPAGELKIQPKGN